MTGSVNPQPESRAIWSTCPRCGKRRYPTRRVARRQARRLYPGDRLSAYPCGTFWHVGHLPDSVKAGEETRDSLRTWRKES